ncbi:MAG: beta-lactamase family protein [Hyphomonas sp.]|nr:beta-lactamase family protein [Hyphomonas sp.]
MAEPPQSSLATPVYTAADDPARAIGAELQRVFAPIAEDRDLSGVVRVERNGDLIAEGVFGLADAETGRPNQAGTLFDVGSITKSFTATLVLILEQEGLIDRDAEVSQYLPGLALGQPVTVRQVMEHRAGLPRDVPEEEEAEVTAEGIVSWVNQQELLFDPGSDEAYSNVGYRLLAELIETVTGEDFPEVLRAKVFLPADLPDARVAGSAMAAAADVATGYEAGPPPLDLRRPSSARASQGDSGVLLSAAQIIDWVEAIDAGRLAQLIPEGEEPIGNVHIRDYDGVSVIQMQGSTPGGGAGVVYSPADGLSVAYAFNISSYPLWGLERSLFRIGQGETLDNLPSARPQPVALEAAHRGLAGRYLHPQFGPIRIEEDEDGMVLEVESLGFRFYLTPIDGGALHWRTFNTVLAKPEGSASLTGDMQLIGSPAQSFELAPAPEETPAEE